jgi:hypothetical protein
MLKQQEMEEIKAIRALLPPPTVWEYIAKIEAHTFDMAKSNAEIARTNATILTELQSVITSEGGAPAVRSLQ